MSKESKISIMGIINVNDDSFYAGSRASSTGEFSKRFLRLAEEGADIIDIGACSSRPGSVWCGTAEEWRRLKGPLEEIGKMRREGMDIPQISIDTFCSEIVERAYDAIGEFIVNDISAGEDDPLMLPAVGRLSLRYVAMHKRGLPADMMEKCDYEKGLIAELLGYFRQFEKMAQLHGISDWILDPGFGFAKSVEQNLFLLENLDKLLAAGHPILVGISRKSMVYKPLDLTPETALEATLKLQKIAVLRGASILRVHDVAETKKAISLSI